MFFIRSEHYDNQLVAEGEAKELGAELRRYGDVTVSHERTHPKEVLLAFDSKPIVAGMYLVCSSSGDVTVAVVVDATVVVPMPMPLDMMVGV